MGNGPDALLRNDWRANGDLGSSRLLGSVSYVPGAAYAIDVELRLRFSSVEDDPDARSLAERFGFKGLMFTSTDKLVRPQYLSDAAGTCGAFLELPSFAHQTPPGAPSLTTCRAATKASEDLAFTSKMASFSHLGYESGPWARSAALRHCDW